MTPSTLVRTTFTALRVGSAALVVARLARGATRPEPITGARLGDRSVSVVVPARNEALRIGPCLQALTRSEEFLDGRLEVVVVDDESTDDTAAVARAAGVRVVDGTTRPDGWAGKPWALQQGIESATHPWIISLDADTRPRPGLVGAAIDAIETQQADLLTLAGRFVCETVGEQVLHPSMLMSLIYRFGPPAPTSDPDRLLANGQCMVLRRDAFLRGGGMAPVSGSLIEDVALARSIVRGGGVVGFVDGSGVLDVQMYESALATWRDWGRSLALAEVTRPRRQALDLAVLWLSFGLPLPRLLSGRGDVLDAAMLAIRLAMTAAIGASYTPTHWARWLSPLADPAVMVRLTQTTLRPERTWRGRTYD